MIRSASDTVHAADPFHLVSSFELLGYALNFSRLLDNKIEHILSVFMNAHKNMAQRAANAL